MTQNRNPLGRADWRTSSHGLIKGAPAARLFSFLAWLAVLSVAAVAWGDIDCKDAYQVGEAIVIKVQPTGVPEGAILRGSLQVAGANVVQPIATESTFYAWAKPGTYVVKATGIWAQTDTGQLGGKLTDLGMYSYEKTFVVGPEVPPGPFPPPVPPGVRRLVILEESADRTAAQAQLWQQLRKEYQPSQLEILDDDQPASSKYLPQVQVAARPVLLVLEADRLIRAIPCPDSVSAIKQEIAK